MKSFCEVPQYFRFCEVVKNGEKETKQNNNAENDADLEYFEKVAKR